VIPNGPPFIVSRSGSARRGARYGETVFEFRNQRGSREIGARDSSLVAGVFAGLDVHRAAGPPRGASPRRHGMSLQEAIVFYDRYGFLDGCDFDDS